MTIFKKIEFKPGEITFGLLLPAITSMVIVVICFIHMKDYEYLKLGWWVFFVVANIGYISKCMKPNPMNGMIIAFGPLAFYFWTVVGTWNKYVEPKPPTSSKKIVLDEINKWVDNTNKEISAGDKPCNVTIKSHYDILRELNDEITERLTKFDIFDIEVPIIRMEQFIQIVKERNLDWRPTDFTDNGKETVVVGKKGVDFDKYEEDR